MEFDRDGRNKVHFTKFVGFHRKIQENLKSQKLSDQKL